MKWLHDGGISMYQGIIIFIILIIAFLSMAFLLLKLHRKAFEERKYWHYTKMGVITDKVVYARRRNKPNTVRPTVRYIVDDKEYEFTSPSGQSPKLRTGKKVGVYYNPDDPNQAVIDTFAQRGSIYKLLGNIFLVFGLFFVYILYSMVQSEL